jgi:ribosomal protein L16/L10AE
MDMLEKKIFKKGSRPAVRPIKYEYVTEYERIKLRLKALSKRRITENRYLDGILMPKKI